MVNANPCARPEFIWRFYSCQKRHYHFVIAPTEDEARSQLPDAPVFSLPAFLPICAILSVTGASLLTLLLRRGYENVISHP
ncbi:hypothetical protein BvCmsKSP021_05114 [Escherichia coli]|nr:hypothetical protein BvCmsKSP021_05114 [Escherichia coli]GDN24530.1 hypothetical protein BvCmsKSP087_05009 [Escherichia coli]